MIEWHDFPNVNFFKMLSFSQVVEAYGLIYPRPSGENFSFVCCQNEKNPFSVVFGLHFFFLGGGKSLRGELLEGKARSQPNNVSKHRKEFFYQHVTPLFK